MEFTEFPKMARLSREVIVTEKIDGTNAQVCIGEDGSMLAGSRTRWITPQDDNHGFAAWVEAHREELLTLGPGRHFGEWWGADTEALRPNREAVFAFQRATVGALRHRAAADCNGRPAHREVAGRSAGVLRGGADSLPGAVLHAGD